MVFIMLPWMRQIEFHPALFALMLLHHFPWSEEVNVLGRILPYQEMFHFWYVARLMK